MTALIPAHSNDIQTIMKLAKSIWQDHYIHIISQEQLDYMLDKMYSSASLLDQMENQNHEFFIIKEQGIEIGFISIKKTVNEVFLNKFYLLSNQQNKGLGTKVFELLKEKIGSFKTMRLTVNRQNYKSINFYFKNNFKIEAVKDFKIGNGYEMNDFIMVYPQETKCDQRLANC